jgi:putative transposase
MGRWHYSEDWQTELKTASCAYRCHYHLVFSTKYRSKVLSLEMATIIAETLLALQGEKAFRLLGLYVGDDHVHILFSLAPKESLADFIKLAKGRSARVLRERFQSLRAMPNLWTSGYWVESLGAKSLWQMKAYLDRQGEHHGKWVRKKIAAD